MIIKKIKMSLLQTIICIFLSITNSVNSDPLVLTENKVIPDIPYKLIDISALSRYSEDRIAFQHIQLSGFSENEDNSVASLLIIKNNEVYLFRDGYDDPKRVKFDSYLRWTRGEEPKDLWVNKIDSRPDYIRVASKRVEKFLNSNKDYTEKNSGDVYRSVRNSFLNYHVKVFKELMMNRAESEFILQRYPIYPPAFKELNAPIIFSSVIRARGQNDYLYYAADKDGDEVTETFWVTMKDSFNWGLKSGPNVIFIYNNKEDNIKQIIGKLCHEAYFGTSEEETNLTKLIPNETDILKAFKLEKIIIKTSQPAK
jgi:hypothetical protein